MITFMMESIAFVLIPIAVVSVLLVGLVLLFARDRALIVFRNLYLYGVLVTSLLVSVVSAIVLFNTLLNTVIFPTQSANDLYYSRPLDSMYGVQYDTGVEDFIRQQQALIDKQVDALSFTQNWSNQLAWALPLLLVSLPLFVLYRRRVIKHVSSENMAETNTNTGTIRYAYLFLTAYLSLIALAIGAIGVINVGVEQYLLPAHYDTYSLRSVLRDELQGKFTYVTMPVAEERSTKAMTTLNNRIQEAKGKQLSINDRNRALSLGFSFLVIGGAIYWWHRKDVLSLINN